MLKMTFLSFNMSTFSLPVSFGSKIYISNTNMSSTSQGSGDDDGSSSSEDSSRSSSDELDEVINCALYFTHWRERGMAMGADDTLMVVGEVLRLRTEGDEGTLGRVYSSVEVYISCECPWNDTRLSFLKYDILVLMETGLTGLVFGGGGAVVVTLSLSPRRTSSFGSTLGENVSNSGEGCCIKKVEGLTPRSRLGENEELEL